MSRNQHNNTQSLIPTYIVAFLCSLYRVRGYTGINPVDGKTDCLTKDEHFFSSPPSLPLFPPPTVHGHSKQPLILVPSKLPQELRTNPAALIPQELTNFKPSFYPPCITFTQTGLKAVLPRRPKSRQYEFSKLHQSASEGTKKETTQKPGEESGEQKHKANVNEAVPKSFNSRPLSRSVSSFTVNNKHKSGGSCPVLPLKASGASSKENNGKITWTEELKILKEKRQMQNKLPPSTENMEGKAGGKPSADRRVQAKELKKEPAVKRSMTTREFLAIGRRSQSQKPQSTFIQIQRKKDFATVSRSNKTKTPYKPTTETRLLNSKPRNLVVFVTEDKKLKKPDCPPWRNIRPSTMKTRKPPASAARSNISTSASLNRKTKNAQLPAQRLDQRRAVKDVVRQFATPIKDKLRNSFVLHQSPLAVGKLHLNAAPMFASRNSGTFKKGQKAQTNFQRSIVVKELLPPSKETLNRLSLLNKKNNKAGSHKISTTKVSI